VLRSVTVAALAVADGPADAVGVVQLACEDDALALTLLRAGAYRSGFVPGSIARSVTLHVPYAAVRGLVRRGKALVLTLDRSVPSPFHRFALARFTDDPAETLAPVHRAHRLASTLSWALPGPIGALAAALPPPSLVGGALGRASLALLVALVAGAAMRALAAWLAWGGPVSDRHREAFEAAISERLGLLPAAEPHRASPGSHRVSPEARRPASGADRPLEMPNSAPEVHTPAPAPRRPLPPGPPQIDLAVRDAPRVPWAHLVGLAGVVALGAVAALAFVRRYGTTEMPAAPELDDTVEAGRADPPPKPAPPPPPPPEERCVCRRADSPLWRDGVPVLSVLTTTGPEGTLEPPASKLDERSKPVFQYDLAVVNNGARAIPETRVVLTYARRDARDRRVGVTDRGLYWGLPLGPGKAVKWITEGPGTEVRIDKSEHGTLEERGIEPAPADAFFALTRARHRVVRMHAAMMLAYLHDPRANEAIAAIGAPVAVESWTLRRIGAAARSIVACDVKAAEGRLSACVFNASTKPGTGLSLREIQDDEARTGRAWPVEVAVPVHDGVRLAWPLEGDPPGDLLVSSDP
jgi:hypothetical protein